MKRLALLLFLSFQVVRSAAQTADTTKLIYNIDTLAKQGAVFIMDGIFLQKPYHLNPDSIIEITILKRDKLSEIFPNSDILNHRPNDFVILISKGGAITAYQKKLSAFSEDYKKEVEFDMIRKLYDTPATQISKVVFSRQQTCCGVNKWVQIFVNQ